MARPQKQDSTLMNRNGCFAHSPQVRDRRVADLPLGRQRLVELGRALAIDPTLLLLDEPSSGMTAEDKEELVFRIKGIREEMGITLILVEHDLKLVMGISDWIAVLDHGVKIAQGAATEVQAQPGRGQSLSWRGRPLGWSDVAQVRVSVATIAKIGGEEEAPDG